MTSFPIIKTKTAASALKTHVLSNLYRSFTFCMLSLESWGVFDSFEEEAKHSKEIKKARLDKR
jgi:hypothetical protein